MLVSTSSSPAKRERASCVLRSDVAAEGAAAGVEEEECSGDAMDAADRCLRNATASQEHLGSTNREHGFVFMPCGVATYLYIAFDSFQLRVLFFVVCFVPFRYPVIRVSTIRFDCACLEARVVA